MILPRFARASKQRNLRILSLSFRTIVPRWEIALVCNCCDARRMTWVRKSRWSRIILLPGRTARNLAFRFLHRFRRRNARIGK